MPNSGWDLDRVLWEAKLNRRKKGEHNRTQNRVCLSSMLGIRSSHGRTNDT